MIQAAVLALLLPSRAIAVTNSLCAVVKLEIKQKAALEREAFNAHLAVNNNLLSRPLSQFKVQISIKDLQGLPADSSFFVKIASLSGTTAVDGTGVVQSNSTADIDWLIIPSPGAGGTTPSGRAYAVSAAISGMSNEAPQSVTTFNAYITVHPQPMIKLEYALPYEVFGDEPLTAQVEPIEPFPLAVRVTNQGYGTARDFQIRSAQPDIVDNKQGLLVDFKLLGTQVAGQTIPDTLLIPMGDLAPNAVGQASWIMSATLSGRFVGFTSTFTHASDLGGPLTSLMQSVTTYTLLKDVQVDAPGRDKTPDFLVNMSRDRASMQASLDAGVQPPAECILESDQPQPLPVTEVAGSLSGTLGGTNAILTLSFTEPVGPNQWVHSSAPFPYGKTVTLTSAKRGDGKVVNPQNVWISKHFRKSDLTSIYWVNILDFSSSTNAYALQFSPNGLDLPPAPVLDLAAASEGNAVALSWTSPGEDGDNGNLFGGRVLIEAERVSTAPFSPASAQLNFSTNAVPGIRQSARMTGLVGNATAYFHLWTQDAGGNISGLSNAATAYVLPNPPTGLSFSAITPNSLALAWLPGNNNPPILYSVSLAPALSSPFQDPFSCGFTFTGLAPNTTYYVSGIAKNPDTGATSPVAQLGSAVTYAVAPSSLAYADVSTGSLTARWSPEEAEFLAELSTSPTHAPLKAGSGWISSSSFHFIGLDPGTTYYGRVKARNKAQVETEYTELGAVATQNLDALPPRTFLLAGVPSFSSSTIYATDATTFSLGAVDDLTSVGDAAGWGVEQIYIAVDTTTFSPYGGAFSLLTEGLHSIMFYGMDAAGHAETARSTTIAVDLTPPSTLLEVFGSSPTDSQGRVLISTAAQMALSAGDQLCGVGKVYVSIDDSTAPYSGPFTLPAGTHTVHYYSEDNVGNKETIHAASFTVRVVDSIGPRTSLIVRGPRSGTSPVFISSLTELGLQADDDLAIFGDGVGWGIAQSFVAIDSGAFSLSTGAFFLSQEGNHGVRFYSSDWAGNIEPIKAVDVFVDTTPPSAVADLAISSVFDSSITLSWTTPRDQGSGMDFYVLAYATFPIDGGNFAVASTTSGASIEGVNPSEPFYAALKYLDRVGNLSALSNLVSRNSNSLSPSSGPIGVPFTITGSGFGAYAGTKTRVLFGGTTAPISVWNDGRISGAIPGLSTGSYAVWIEPKHILAGNFQVILPEAYSLTPSSAPIGSAFTISGTGFGPYAGSLTSVLFNGTTAPISAWNDSTIKGTIPGIAPGTAAVSVLRKTSGGAMVRTPDLPFEVLVPSITAVIPSSGPIGITLTVLGVGFGPYVGSLTQLLIGDTTAPISAWNDGRIKAVVPGALSPNDYLVKVRRRSSDGGLVESGAVGFQVTDIAALTLSPSSGPIGVPFTITGASFGPYAGANTRVRFGSTSASISSWNDAKITGTVPGLSTGTYGVFVERGQGGVFDSDDVGSFSVLMPEPAAMTPSSAPIGAPFTISGSGFGPYAGSLTVVLFNGTTAPISVWNDRTISGTVPGISTGTAVVVLVRRTSDGGRIQTLDMPFDVLAPSITAMTPSSAPIGAAFTLKGAGFGPYAGAKTVLLMAGTTAPISVWNDTTITAVVPGALPVGLHPVQVRRQASNGVTVESGPVDFLVTQASIAAMSPSSGPIGVPFTITGTSFGSYAGANTRIKFGSTAAAISAWNDSRITGTAPGISTGTYEVVVERQQGAFVTTSEASSFMVIAPEPTAMTPSSAPIGAPFTLSGTGFGPYAGSLTVVLFNGTTAPISVWNDRTISGTVPGISTGTAAVVLVRKTSDGGRIQTPDMTFDVLVPSITAMTPSSAPIGSPFTLKGAGFGPYGGANTRVKFGSTAAAISAWNDARITGTVPGLSTGTYGVVVERQQGMFVSSSNASSFMVLAPAIASLTPSSAPIGASFTIKGTAFGPYAGANTRVRIGSLAASISVWNDTTITGTVPGASSTGTATLLVERLTSGGGYSAAEPRAFDVLVPRIDSLAPAYGKPGSAVTLSGVGFGPYGGSATKLYFGAMAASISIWNDRMIRAIVPDSLSYGTTTVVVVRSPSGGVSRSNEMAFNVGASAMGVSSLMESAHPDWHYEARLDISAAEGGRVESPLRASVEIDPNAMEEDREITISKGRLDSEQVQAREKKSIAPAGPAFEFGPEGALFASAVTIELPFSPPEGGEVGIHTWDPLEQDWVALRGEVDWTRRKVRARTTHFSLYQAMAPAPRPSAASAEFGMHNAYVYPNPARGGARPTLHVEAGLADGLKIRIYDVAGRLVHEARIEDAPGIVNDGSGPKYAYEYTWEGHIPSGVYFYAVEADKAGQGSVRRIGRMAVVR